MISNRYLSRLAQLTVGLTLFWTMPFVLSEPWWTALNVMIVTVTVNTNIPAVAPVSPSAAGPVLSAALQNIRPALVLKAILEAEFTPNLTSISYPQPSTGDDGTKCYKKSAFACKGGYNKFTSHPDSPYVTYTTQSPFSDKSLQCVTGYSKTGNRYYESRPSNTDCLEMSSINLSLLPTPKNLYYFTGSCSSSTGCTTTKKDCVSYNSQKGTTKTGGSVTCNKISGCQSGLVGSYICGTTAASSSYFTSEKVTDGTTTCYKVSGCKTGSGYEQAYIGTSPAADYTTKSGSNYTYTVQKYTAGSASLVCRTPSGCRTGYYNFACEGGCWNGWLSLWAQ